MKKLSPKYMLGHPKILSQKISKHIQFEHFKTHTLKVLQNILTLTFKHNLNSHVYLKPLP